MDIIVGEKVVNLSEESRREILNHKKEKQEKVHFYCYWIIQFTYSRSIFFLLLYI